MTEHSNTSDTSVVPILLVGCEDTTAKPWQQASDKLGLQLIRLTQSSDCRSYIAAHGAACIVATTWPKVDATMLDASDNSFKRSTVILVSKEPKEVELWQSISWDVYFEQVEVETAIDALKAGTEEAFRRRDDWNLVEKFHHRESSLNNDESLVMVSICRGLLNKKIASNFGVSIRTVEQRRRHVFEKMQVDSVAPLASLVAKAYEIERRGLKRNSPSLKRSRFWSNWDSAHSLEQSPPHADFSKNSKESKKGPHAENEPLKSRKNNNNQTGT